MVRKALQAEVGQSRQKSISCQLEKKEPLKGTGTRSIDQVGADEKEEEYKNCSRPLFDLAFQIRLALHISQQKKKGQVDVKAGCGGDETEIQGDFLAGQNNEKTICQNQEGDDCEKVSSQEMPVLSGSVGRSPNPGSFPSLFESIE